MDSNTLDSGQYAIAEIEKYEAVYGRNFISPGGLATAQAFTALLKLTPGMTVLDVGCGIGGSAFHMAQQYGAQVHGIDLSQNMITFANERCREAHLTEYVTFAHGDILALAAKNYDYVYSRDVFLHIHDKAQLFHALKNNLKPGGYLVFTDYCCGAGQKSPEFAAYIRQRDYDLHAVPEYGKLIETAGFVDVLAEDRTAQFIDILQHELAHLPTKQFDAPTLRSLCQSWQDKIARAQRGEQCWGLFCARRPVAG